MKNAIINGRKREANTIEHNRQEYRTVRLFLSINEINILLLNRGPIWLLDYSFYEWTIESTNQIIFPFMNLLVH